MNEELKDKLFDLLDEARERLLAVKQLSDNVSIERNSYALANLVLALQEKVLEIKPISSESDGV
jgi:hypothetical protein